MTLLIEKQPVNRLPLYWQGEPKQLHYTEDEIKELLENTSSPCFIVQTEQGIAFTSQGTISSQSSSQDYECLGFAPACSPEELGNPSFREDYGTKAAYYAGSMANGIASIELVIAMGKAGYLSSFGAAGLEPAKIEHAIKQIQQALPHGPYAFNLIHSPAEALLEEKATELYLKHNVRAIEASAFLDLTPNLVWYRAAGLEQGPQGIMVRNHIIAKISRREVAQKFMKPAPEKILEKLVQANKITPEQAQLARQVPIADDITVEADSGGHTDNRPLVCLLPSLIELRDEIQAEHDYPRQIRVGAAGGISVPQSALAAYIMGADYIVTGSVNQACVEAGTSMHTKELLAQAGFADVMMAPAADMFEMGVKLQVLKRGSFFPLRANKLYEIYTDYPSLEAIPTAEKQKLEKQIFKNSLEEIWRQTLTYFQSRDPQQITKAQNNPKRKMALVFRWYLGQSSNWANTGVPERKIDYQIWCGPAMGIFNDWVRGTYLQEPSNRKVVDVARHIMQGAAYLYRIRQLENNGLRLPAQLFSYKPRQT